MRQFGRNVSVTLAGLLLVVLAGTMLYSAPVSADSGTLVVSGWGGAWERAMRDTVIEPFQKAFHVQVTLSLLGPSTQIMAQLRAERGHPSRDVVMIGGGLERIAAAEGLMVKLNYSAIPNWRDLDPTARDVLGYGPSVAFTGVGLAYLKDKVNPAPTSWSDLWNPQYKGRIAVADMVANYGLAFFAYMNRANGGSESNPAPGWARVRDLVTTQQPLIYQTDDQAVTAVTQEGAVLVVMPNSRAIQLAKQGLPIGFVFPKEGGFGWGNYGGIPVGAAHPRLAEEFINFWLSPEVQTNWAMAIGYSPTNLKSRIPSNYAYNRYLLSPNDYSKIQPLDWAWINKNRAAWIEKWQQDVLPLVRH